MATFIAAGFGSGYAPGAPGTCGSLVASIPGLGIALLWGWQGLAIATGVLWLIAHWSTYVVLPTLPVKDPSWIVVDEWLGLWLAMLLVLIVAGELNAMSMALAFTFFRVFDILKPWPVSWMERLGPNWVSIHSDDVAAGLLGGGMTVFILRFL